MTIKKTLTDDPDFRKLEKMLDSTLRNTYDDQMDFYEQYNRFPMPINCVVIFVEEKPIACGAFKELNQNNSVEIKRMFVHPEYRRKGYSKIILNELENWARQLGKKKALLETGLKQTAAISLYQKNNYQVTENFEPYVGVETSICMEKVL